MQTLFSKVDGGSVWYLVTRGSEGVTRFLLIDSLYTTGPRLDYSESQTQTPPSRI